MARRRSGERMAWQSPASMSANGGSSTAGDGGAVGQGQAHGTEYTLQGITAWSGWLVMAVMAVLPGLLE